MKKNVLIIGAGISGVSIAYNLALRALRISMSSTKATSGPGRPAAAAPGPVPKGYAVELSLG
jgi:glycine/D-amino acid oxidase-like deaminating enzyme